MRSAYQSMNKKQTKTKKRSWLINVIVILYTLITILFFGYIVCINMIPAKFLIPVVVLGIVITLFVIFLMMKRRKTMIVNIIGVLLACVIVVGYGVIYNYLSQAFNFLDAISVDQNVEVEQFYVVALSDSEYKEQKDINGKEIEVLEITENIDKVEEKLKQEANTTFKNVDSLEKLEDNLLNGKTDLILLSSTQYSMITEENEDFKEKTKVIYTITQEIETKNEEAIKDENSKHTIENGVFNVYISGIDTSGNIKNVSRSDANIVVTVNINTHEILLTSIPRDYYVTLHSKQAKDKLTHSGIYGINETVSTVEDLLGIDINYYVRVNFTTVEKLVDAIGGIEVYSDFAFTGVGIKFNKGLNYLNGKEALAFSRERHSFASGDVQRAKNQQKVINAIISKLTSSTTLLTRYSNILDSLAGNFQTNIETSDISSIVKEQLNSMPSWNITTNTLIGTGSYDVTYSCGSQKLYVMVPNSESVEDAKQKINTVMGED